MIEYEFVIPGACPPKGSRVPVRKGSDKTRESSKRVEPWTEGAVRCMRDSLGKPRASFSGPVYVGATFVYKRPKVTGFPFPTAINIGDLDKLLRCLLDALTKAGVIEDDRFVVEFAHRPRKIWGDTDHTIAVVGSARPVSMEQGRIVDALEVTSWDGEPRFIPGAVVPNPYGPSVIDFEALAKEPPGFA